MSPLLLILLGWGLLATAAAIRFALLAADYASQAERLTDQLRRGGRR